LATALSLPLVGTSATYLFARVLFQRFRGCNRLRLIKTIGQVDQVDSSVLSSLSRVDLLSILRTEKIGVLQVLNIVIDLGVSALVARVLELAPPIELEDLARARLLLATLEHGTVSSLEDMVL
jgi:hypothetical protein